MNFIVQLQYYGSLLIVKVDSTSGLVEVQILC